LTLVRRGTRAPASREYDFFDFASCDFAGFDFAGFVFAAFFGSSYAATNAFSIHRRSTAG
jgi:hypothetical protein